MEKYVKGVAVAFIIGLIAQFIAPYLGKLGSVTIAIFLGVLVGNLLSLPQSLGVGIKFSEKHILGSAILLMGLRLDAHVVAGLGVQSVLLIALAMCGTILFSILIGRLLGVNQKLSVLLGVGTAVCGSSAIAAASPVVKGKENDMGLSIAVVNFLGSIGILIVPLVVLTLNLVLQNAALVVGGSLQAVGHVVAAGFSLSDSIGELATVVKMTRIVMLAPMLLILSMMFKGEGKKKFSLPYFIVGFFICMILVSLGMVPGVIASFFVSLSKQLLIIAMAAVGLRINLHAILKVGPKALGLGIILMALQTCVILLLLAV